VNAEREREREREREQSNKSLAHYFVSYTLTRRGHVLNVIQFPMQLNAVETVLLCGNMWKYNAN